MPDSPKFNPKATHRPLTPTTVKILGSVYDGENTIWAGLNWQAATLSETNEILGAPDHHLNVPWCHIADEQPGGGCVYRVRPRFKGWRFVKATNGTWVLQYVTEEESDA